MGEWGEQGLGRWLGFWSGSGALRGHCWPLALPLSSCQGQQGVLRGRLCYSPHGGDLQGGSWAPGARVGASGRSQTPPYLSVFPKRVMSAFTMRETQMRRHGPSPHTRSSDGPWDTALQAAGVRMRGVSSTRGKREARWSRSRTVPRLRSQSVRVNRHKDDPSFSKAPLFRLLGGVGSVTALCLESLLERTRRGHVEPRWALPVGRPASRRDDRVVSHLGTRQPPLAVGPPLQSGPGQGLAGVLRASC